MEKSRAKLPQDLATSFHLTSPLILLVSLVCLVCLVVDLLSRFWFRPSTTYSDPDHTPPQQTAAPHLPKATVLVPPPALTQTRVSRRKDPAE